MIDNYVPSIIYNFMITCWLGCFGNSQPSTGWSASSQVMAWSRSPRHSRLQQRPAPQICAEKRHFAGEKMTNHSWAMMAYIGHHSFKKMTWTWAMMAFVFHIAKRSLNYCEYMKSTACPRKIQGVPWSSRCQHEESLAAHVSSPLQQCNSHGSASPSLDGWKMSWKSSAVICLKQRGTWIKCKWRNNLFGINEYMILINHLMANQNPMTLLNYMILYVNDWSI